MLTLQAVESMFVQDLTKDVWALEVIRRFPVSDAAERLKNFCSAVHEDETISGRLMAAVIGLLDWSKIVGQISAAQEEAQRAIAPQQ